MSHELAWHLIGTPIALARTSLIVLTGLLLAAAWFDVRQQRIPNSLVAPGAVLALLLHAVAPAGNGFLGDMPGGLGAWGALSGLLLGLLLLLPLYLLRGMGAGDVKLLAMVGAFLGTEHVGWVLLASVLVGGGLALAVALRRRLMGRVLQNLRLMMWNVLLRFSGAGAGLPEFGVGTVAALPFGVAIAAGGIGYLSLQATRLGLL